MAIQFTFENEMLKVIENFAPVTTTPDPKITFYTKDVLGEQRLQKEQDKINAQAAFDAAIAKANDEIAKIDVLITKYDELSILNHI